MNISEAPTSIIIFVIGQTATAAWAIITMWFDIKSIKVKMAESEIENAELKKELREMKDLLIKVDYATSQLMLGRIKTGRSMDH